MTPPTLAQARGAAHRLCAAAGVTLVEPGSPLRVIIIAAVYAAARIGGGTWTHEHASQHVSVTLPGAGTALDLLGAIPMVGPLLVAAVRAAGGSRPIVCISPSTWADPVGLLEVVQHELGHVGQIRAGGLPWCLVYLGHPELRGGAESSCYGAGMAVAAALGGHSADVLATRALSALEGYALDEPATRLARGVIASAARSVDAGDDFGGVVGEVFAALEAEGWHR